MRVAGYCANFMEVTTVRQPTELMIALPQKRWEWSRSDFPLNQVSHSPRKAHFPIWEECRKLTGMGHSVRMVAKHLGLHKVSVPKLEILGAHGLPRQARPSAVPANACPPWPPWRRIVLALRFQFPLTVITDTPMLNGASFRLYLQVPRT
jgi:hypothetical protein